MVIVLCKEETNAYIYHDNVMSGIALLYDITYNMNIN